MQLRKIVGSLIVATVAVATLVAAPPATAAELAPAPSGASEWVTLSTAADGTKVTTRSRTSAPEQRSDGTFDQATEYTVYIAKPAAGGGGIVRPLDDSGGGTNDGTASVNVWNSLNFTRINGTTIRANYWGARFTRLDPGAGLNRGQLVHRNDSAAYSGTQTWNSPTSGITYTFTPSYAGVNTNQAAGVGIFGTANLRWTYGGSTYTTYAPTIHP